VAFSVSRSHPLRSLGLYKKSSGKHAAPRGSVADPRPAGSTGQPYRPAHAATSPRLTGPHAAIDEHIDAAAPVDPDRQANAEARADDGEQEEQSS
jgi:hypothetical protein